VPLSGFEGEDDYMDLIIVENNFKAGNYINPDEVIRDLNKIWDYFMRYSQIGQG
jgi:hypothetical protein